MRLYSCNYEENPIPFKWCFTYLLTSTCRVGYALFEILAFELKMLDD